MEHFHWSPSQIDELTVDEYKEFLQIITIKNSKTTEINPNNG